MKSRLLLNVVFGESASIFELLTGEDQALLIRRDTFLVLNLGLDVVDGVGRLHFKGDGLAWILENINIRPKRIFLY